MERHLEAAAALRADHALPSIGGHHQVAVAHLNLLRGDWDATLEICGAAGFELEQQGAKVGATLLRLMECELLSICGNVDKAGALLRELDDPLEELRSQLILCQARVARALGDIDGALELLEAQAERSARATTVLRRAELLTELADLLVELGREEDACAIAAEVESLALEPCRHEWPLAALHLRARLWGDVDAARDYLELAERERIELDRARAELVLGELDEDPFEHLTSAYRAFDALGAGPWRRRAAAALRARNLTVPRPAQRLGGTLTDTEGQLVRLVAEGLTNRQIASALHYSPKTIEVYLSRVYAKTGCASRIELIRALDSGALELTV
jgi:DNA-binding CsgD family transcriptional regulator